MNVRPDITADGRSIPAPSQAQYYVAPPSGTVTIVTIGRR